MDEENAVDATIPLAYSGCDSNAAAPLTLNGYFGCKNPYGFLSTVSVGAAALISISGYVSLWAILAIAIPPR